jgi:hypothetical protein
MNFDTVQTALEKLAGYEKVDVALPLPTEIPGLKKAYFTKKKDDTIRYGGLSPLAHRPPMNGSLQDQIVPFSQDKLVAAFTLQPR